MSTELPPAGEQPPAVSDRGALYRTYRSRTFDEVVGQAHVTQTLRNAVRYGKVAHAYLFTGPRGTGKTSTARILARAVNCLQPRDGEPCNACAVCVSMIERRSLDLVEIDGASNNSVEDVRELRDRVNLRPAEGRRKVFIIDEIQMLSPGAFNALLKTLEEPPEHVLFALATTELQKVPATVRSRCQLLELRPIPPEAMADRIAYVCASEGITAGDDVIRFISAQATGSLRDALSLLQQIRAFCGDQLRLDDVETALGIARVSQVEDLGGAMASGDLAGALLVAENLMDGGVDPRQLGKQLTGYWRNALVARARKQRMEDPRLNQCRAEQIVPVLYSLLNVESAARRSDSPRWALETGIAEATLRLAGRLDHVSESPVEAAEAQGSAAHAPRVTAGLPAPEARPRTVPPTAAASEPALGPVAPDIEPEASTPWAAGPAAAATEPPPAQAEPERSALPNRPRVPEPTPSATAPEVGGDPLLDAPSPVADPSEAAPAGEALKGGNAASADFDPRRLWPEVLNRLRQQRKSRLAVMLQKVDVPRISVEGRVLALPLRPTDSFAREQLEHPTQRLPIEAAVSEVYGGQWSIRYVTINETVSTAGNDPAHLDYLDEIVAEIAGPSSHTT